MSEPFGHEQVGAPPGAGDRHAVLPGDLGIAAVVDDEQRHRQRRGQRDHVEGRPGPPDALLDSTLGTYECI